MSGSGRRMIAPSIDGMITMFANLNDFWAAFRTDLSHGCMAIIHESSEVMAATAWFARGPVVKIGSFTRQVKRLVRTISGCANPSAT